MLSVNKINNFNYQTSKANSEKQSSMPKFASNGSKMMPSIPAAAYGLNFAGRSNTVVKLPDAVQKIFEGIDFVREGNSVISSIPLRAEQVSNLLKRYINAQRGDLGSVVQAVKFDSPADIDAFYTALLGNVERYPLEWGMHDKYDKLCFHYTSPEYGFIMEAEPGDSISKVNPQLGEYLDKTLPELIKANGGKTPDNLRRVVEYKGKKYEITPELETMGDTAGMISLFSRELKAA